MKKQSILFLLLVAVIGIVGLTVAYFSSTTTFENEFQTPEYGTTYIEKFTSPDNWLPGDETEKTLEVTNSGNVDEAVRVKVEESWISKNNTSLPLTQGDNVAADIHWINDDDWTKVTVDEEDYYYYYYNYKLAPGETTSKLLDKVTFNSAITSSATCSDTIVDGTTTRTCNSNETGYDGSTYTLTLTVETVQYNKYSDAWNTDIEIAEEMAELENFAQHIVDNANSGSVTNYNNGVKTEAYVFTHPQTEQTPALTDYRYIGNVPNNYVKFNCDNDGSNCEIWRIIGVFSVDDGLGNYEQRVKLVRGLSFENIMGWHTVSQNDWMEASLRIFLNGDYYNRSGDASSIGLKESARNKVSDTKYYLGGVTYLSEEPRYGTTENLYEVERGSTVYTGRIISWVGKVALMYPSDHFFEYAYGVDNACFSNPGQCSVTDYYYNSNWEKVIYTRDNPGYPESGWMFNSNLLEGENKLYWTWLLSPSAPGYAGGTFVITSGQLNSGSSANNLGVRPVVYLSADVKIVSGDGSEGNPYRLK